MSTSIKRIATRRQSERDFSARAENFLSLANRSAFYERSAYERSAQRGLGFVALSRGQNEEAVTHWRQAKLPASTLLSFGADAEELGGLEEALSWYELAAELDLSESAQTLGSFLYAQQNYAEAAATWQRALEHHASHPDRVDWWSGLADSFTIRREWAETIAVSQAGLREFPNSAALYTDLGRAIFRRHQDAAEAERILTQAIEVDPTFAEAYAAMADIAKVQKDYEEAHYRYSQAVMHDPTVKWWHVEQANMLRAEGNVAESLDLYEKFIEREPFYAPVYFEAAWAYQMQDQLTQAEQAIEQAIALRNSPNANYLIRAGQIYERNHRDEEARAAYEQAQALTPGDRRVQAGLQRLELK